MNGGLWVPKHVADQIKRDQEREQGSKPTPPAGMTYPNTEDAFLKPDDYIGEHGKRSVDFKRSGFVVIRVLEVLDGRPWDELALSVCLALRPDNIVATYGGVTTGGMEGSRLVVFITREKIIEKIQHEVWIGLPDSCRCGGDFSTLFRETAPEGARKELS